MQWYPHQRLLALFHTKGDDQPCNGTLIKRLYSYTCSERCSVKIHLITSNYNIAHDSIRLPPAFTNTLVSLSHNSTRIHQCYAIRSELVQNLMALLFCLIAFGWPHNVLTTRTFNNNSI